MTTASSTSRISPRAPSILTRASWTPSWPTATSVSSAASLLEILPTSPIAEVRRLGRTLKRWSEPLLAYFDTDGASNGGTEAINGLIELHRRIARGFRNRDNYRLRMLLIGGGLNP